MNINDSVKPQVQPIVESEKKKTGSNIENRQDSTMESPTRTRIVSHVPVPAQVSVGGTTSTESSLSSSTASVCGPRSRVRSDETFRTPSSDAGDSVRSAYIQRCEPAEPLASHNTSTGGTADQRKRKVDAVAVESKDAAGPTKKPRPQETASKLQEIAPAPAKITLLAQPTDSEVLSPLHVFVRQQIEVFTATQADMTQPAPGRKNPVQSKQVGLRCIHCRELSVRERVKRAVCYPSSVGRVYHSVSDMKFDHFGNCKGMPPELKATFLELKADGKKKKDNKKPKGAIGTSSTTAQYYHDTARRMGMIDGGGGVFIEKELRTANKTEPTTMFEQSSQPAKQTCLPPKPHGTSLTGTAPIIQAPKTLETCVGSSYTIGRVPPQVHGNIPSALALGQELFAQNLSTHAIAPFLISMMMLRNAKELTQTPAPQMPTDHGQSRRTLLCSPSDPEYLNPLHCFVRRNLEVFAADKDDVAAPAPGRKNRVHLGQVGIRCIYCSHLPVKDRVKRAVCYPPSLSQIYHAVSNMKFDHFGSCRGLPLQGREEFSKLQASYKRKGSSLPGANATQVKGTSNSTAQYYHDSAVRLGLVDTDNGIRFKAEDPPPVAEPKKVEQVQKEVVPDGISALVIAATGCASLATGSEQV